MKKCISLSLIILLCSCSGGKSSSPSGSTTKFYNPNVSYEEMVSGTEISEDEFKEAVNANYVEPKSRYELMKCSLTSDGKIGILGEDIEFDSLNAYFSLIDTPSGNEDNPPLLFGPRADLEGTLFGYRADISYWMPVKYMYDVREWVSSGDASKYFKSPFAIEYGERETVRVVYDDQFLPIQVERKTPNNETIQVWHYDLAYFNPNDVEVKSGNVSEEAYAEHYMKICNNSISYSSYAVHITGKYPGQSQLKINDNGTIDYVDNIKNIDVSFNGTFRVSSDAYSEKDYPKTLAHINYEMPTVPYDYDFYYYLASSFSGIEKVEAVLPQIPINNGLFYKFYDSPFRVEVYNCSIKNNVMKVDYSFRRYYLEYNQEGLITKYINTKFTEKNTKCDLEYTFSYQ